MKPIDEQRDPMEVGYTSASAGMKFDADKLRYDLLEPHAQRELVAVLTFGSVKYEAGNWRKVPDASERYYAALLRHLEDHRLGKLQDPETSLLHLAHAMCCLHFLLQIEAEKPATTGTFEGRFAHAMKVASELRAKRLGGAATSE